ncbi:OmpA family protein [Andreprevotia chitinilytica]|uniref:OmpA family protein n=1 Tax=Andreprevotia chitinilytica TaxID=396808 RepID=UPI0012EC8C0D|nr:OmpA family protein [Andreprevotia chitinilytica]
MKRVSICLVGLALIAGCAETPQQTAETKKGEAQHWLRDTATNNSNTSIASAPAAAKTPATVQASAPAAAGSIVGPVKVMAGDLYKIDFDAMSIAISEAGKNKVAGLIDQAKAAKTISIRGYCDRTKVGNAQKAALARANAVKAEFVKAGIPAGKFQLRATTDEPTSAAVVEFL